MIAWLAPIAYLTAARAALWLRDSARATAMLDLLRETTHGPAIAASVSTLEAGLAALAGDRDKALAGYRSALEGWHDLGLPVDEALTAIDMATLLGPGLAPVDAAAATARDTLRRLGANRFLDRLVAAMDWSSGTAPAGIAGGSAPVATLATEQEATASARPGEVPAS
jgi:hypothetical protein